jgi:hypothetical protein
MVGHRTSWGRMGGWLRIDLLSKGGQSTQPPRPRPMARFAQAIVIKTRLCCDGSFGTAVTSIDCPMEGQSVSTRATQHEDNI